MQQTILSTAVAVILCATASTTYAAKPTDKSIQKVIKTVVNAIKYKKDDMAAKQIAFAPMTERIMGPYWKETGEADQKELAAGVETLIRKISFKKGRETFQYLDAILYKPIRVNNDDVRCTATIVVHRNYKKTELVIEFILVNSGGSWRIVDTIMAGESTAEGILEDQIEPLVDEGGIPAVMKALRKKLAEAS